MKNVTVTMDEATLEWVRVKAARENASVARYLGQLVEQARARDGAYDRDMRRALQFRELPIASGAQCLLAMKPTAAPRSMPRTVPIFVDTNILPYVLDPRDALE